uniref:Putative extracellular solute-binding protein n=1 Tax=Arthrobacter globiformis TaxID=1665 RepID=B8R4K6_ARTGO|nr:putative extracellular solute-binding protein [Arthrobacter globiformis]
MSKTRIPSWRHTLAATAIVALAATAVACAPASDNADKEHILSVGQIGNASFVQNFNPFSPNSLAMTNRAIYESLLVTNLAKGEILPWLAKEYTWSADGRELTMNLNDGVQWSDGEDFSSADVVFTFDLVREVRGESAFDYLEGWAAPDPTTVVFTFNRTYTPALAEIGTQTIVPEHVWAEVDDPTTFLNEEPVGTGPFTEVDKFTAQSYDLRKNPNYWQEGKPQFDAMRMIAYGSNDTANLAGINGELDWGLGYMQNVQEVYVDEDPEHRGFWFPTVGGMVSLAVNTTKAPFDDVNLRKAMSMAIDREEVAEIGMTGYTHPADCTGLSDAYDSWKDPAIVDSCEWTEYDPEAAARLLDESGYVVGSDGIRVTPDGQPLSFGLSVGAASTDWVSVMKVVSEGLQAVGIDATLDVADWSQIDQKVFLGEFDAAIRGGVTGLTPYEYYRSVMSCDTVLPVGEQAVQNSHRFCSEAADEQLAILAAATTEEEQMAAGDQLQSIFDENAPLIPLFPGPVWGIYNDIRFTGFPTENNPYATLSTGESSTVIILNTLKPRQ